jgi:anti-sigma regulatory factor (Ser/Thr protein kinase)
MGGGRAVRFALPGGLDEALMEELAEATRGLVQEAGVPQDRRHGIHTVVTEICSNVLEHSNAQWIELALISVGDSTFLSVSDNGDPFDSAAVIEKHDFNLENLGKDGRHLGLFMIRSLTQSIRYLREEDGVNRIMMQMAEPKTRKSD